MRLRTLSTCLCTPYGLLSTCAVSATAAGTVKLSIGSARLSTPAPTAAQVAASRAASSTPSFRATRPWSDAKSRAASAAAVPATKNASDPAGLCDKCRFSARHGKWQEPCLASQLSSHLVAVVRPLHAPPQPPADNVREPVPGAQDSYDQDAARRPGPVSEGGRDVHAPVHGTHGSGCRRLVTAG